MNRQFSARTAVIWGLAILAIALVYMLLRPNAINVDALPVATLNLGAPPQASKSNAYNLVKNLDREILEQATRDPFLQGSLPAQKSVTKPDVIKPPMQVALPSTTAVPVPVALAPDLNLRFIGRITAPDGTQSIYAQSGEASIILMVGQTLPNGYRIESIKERVVELSYPPLNTIAKLDLPEAPRYEIR